MLRYFALCKRIQSNAEVKFHAWGKNIRNSAEWPLKMRWELTKSFGNLGTVISLVPFMQMSKKYFIEMVTFKLFV